MSKMVSKHLSTHPFPWILGTYSPIKFNACNSCITARQGALELTFVCIKTKMPTYQLKRGTWNTREANYMVKSNFPAYLQNQVAGQTAQWDGNVRLTSPKATNAQEGAEPSIFRLALTLLFLRNLVSSIPFIKVQGFKNMSTDLEFI